MSSAQEKPNNFENRQFDLKNSLELTDQEQEILSHIPTSLGARLDLQRGADDVIAKIKDLVDAKPKDLFGKFKSGLSKFANLKSRIDHDWKNNTIGAEIYSSLFGNRESEDRQLKCKDSYEANVELIQTSLKDVNISPEQNEAVQQIIQNYKNNWVNYAKKVDIMAKSSQKDPLESAKNVNVDYYQTEVNQKNIVAKYASRLVLVGATGLAGIGFGAALPFVMGGARGLTSGLIEEKRRVDVAEDNLIRENLETAGIDLVELYNSGFLQEILSDPEKTISPENFEKINDFIVGLVAKYGHKFNGELDSVLVEMQLKLLDIKSKNKVIDKSFDTEEATEFVEKVEKIQESIDKVRTNHEDKTYRKQADNAEKNGKWKRIGLNVAGSIAAVGAGWGVRHLVNGTLGDELKGLYRQVTSPSYATQVGDHGYLVSSHATAKIEELTKAGYHITTIDGHSQTGELVALTKDGHDISFAEADKAIQQNILQLPHSSSVEHFSYKGSNVQGIIQIHSNHQIDGGLVFNDAHGNQIDIIKGDSGKFYNIDGREYSVLGNKDGNLLLVDVQNHSEALQKTLGDIIKDPSIEKYQGWLGDIQTGAGQMFQNTRGFVSDGIDSALNIFNHSNVDTQNYFGPLGGGARFNGGDPAHTFANWFKDVQGGQVGSHLGKINPNVNYEAMGQRAVNALETGIRNHQNAFTLGDGTPVHSLADLHGNFGNLHVANRAAVRDIADSLARSVRNDLRANFPGWQPNTPAGLDTFIAENMGGTVNTGGGIQSLLYQGLGLAAPGAFVGAISGGIRGYNNADNQTTGKSRVRRTIEGVGNGVVSGGVTSLIAGGAATLVGAGAIAGVIGGGAEVARRGFGKLGHPDTGNFGRNLVGQFRQNTPTPPVAPATPPPANTSQQPANNSTPPVAPANPAENTPAQPANNQVDQVVLDFNAIFTEQWIRGIPNNNNARQLIQRYNQIPQFITRLNALRGTNGADNTAINTHINAIRTIQRAIAERLAILPPTIPGQIDPFLDVFDTTYSDEEVAKIESANDRNTLQNQVQDLDHIITRLQQYKNSPNLSEADTDKIDLSLERAEGILSQVRTRLVSLGSRVETPPVIPDQARVVREYQQLNNEITTYKNALAAINPDIVILPDQTQLRNTILKLRQFREKTARLDQDQIRLHLTQNQRDQNIINNHWVLSQLLIFEIEPLAISLERNIDKIMLNPMQIPDLKNQISIHKRDVYKIHDALSHDADYRNSEILQKASDLFTRLHQLEIRANA
jgi:hypothetical protein